MPDLTVACVLNVKGVDCDFDVQYVQRLERGVARHLHEPYRFICLTNVDCEGGTPLERGYPGWWAKMELFRPGLAEGRILFLDLDTIIVGDLTDIADVSLFTMIRWFDHQTHRGSGLMMIPPRIRETIWRAWIFSGEKCNGREQDFIATFCDLSWEEQLPGQVVSYKHHVRKRGLSPDARIVCFHGKPRPAELPFSDPLRTHWT